MGNGRRDVEIYAYAPGRRTAAPEDAPERSALRVSPVCAEAALQQAGPAQPSCPPRPRSVDRPPVPFRVAAEAFLSSSDPDSSSPDAPAPPLLSRVQAVLPRVLPSLGPRARPRPPSPRPSAGDGLPAVVRGRPVEQLPTAAARRRQHGFFHSNSRSPVSVRPSAGALPQREGDITQPPLTAQTLQIRARALRALAQFDPAFVPLLPGVQPARAWDMPLPELNQRLIAYGQHLFSGNAKSHRYRNTLLAIQDRLGVTHLLSSAWRALRAWVRLDPPSHSHIPLGFDMLRAMVVVALLGDRPGFAALLLILFFGLLRPGEGLALVREHLSFPEDRGSSDGALFVALARHKTRGGRTLDGAHHAMLRWPILVDFLRRVCLGVAPAAPVYSVSVRGFQRTWDDICAFLCIPVGRAIGYTPASCRAGGATWLYISGVPLPQIRWQLRHATESSGRHYIQAAGAALASARLSEQARFLVERFASGFDRMLQERGIAPPRLRALSSITWLTDDERRPPVRRRRNSTSPRPRQHLLALGRLLERTAGDVEREAPAPSSALYFSFPPPPPSCPYTAPP